MENLDEINELFLQLEEAEYHGDQPLVNALSKKVHKILKERGQEMMDEQPGEAADMFLSSSEMIRDQDFHEAVSLVRGSLDCLHKAARKAEGRGEHALAAEQYKKIAEIHAEIFEDAMMARTYLSIVIRHFERFLHEARTMGSDLPSPYNHHYTLAELHATMENWKDAERQARLAIEKAKARDKFFMVATAYRLLLNVKLHLGDNKEMLDMFIEARTYFQAILNGIESRSKRANFMDIAEVYHVFAGFYDIMEDNEEFKNISMKEAECYLNMAKEREREDDVGAAIYYHSAALVLNKNNKQEATASFIASARRYEAAGIFDSAADNLILASNCLEEDPGQLGDAITLVQEGVDLLARAGHFEIALSNLRGMRFMVEFLEDRDVARDLDRLLGEKELCLLSCIADDSEGRQAARYHVEIARIHFLATEQGKGIEHLKRALDLFKASHSVNPRTRASNSIDMLAIVLIALILDREDDVERHVSLLDREGQKTPFGKYLATMARKIRTMVSSGIFSTRDIVLANPGLQTLLAILEQHLQ